MAADEAGKHLVQMSKRLSDLKVDAKGYNNLVSNADHAAEKIIVEKIQTAYPDHAIVAEESGRLGSESSEIVWVIDPLDGTFNYLHGFPHYSVSIACMVRGKFEHGLIFDPVRDEMFMASQGAGAFVRYMSTSQRLRVSRVKSVRGSLIGVSGGYTPEVQSSMLDIQTQLVSKKSVVRKSGSAALDIAYVACGRLMAISRLIYRYGIMPQV